MKKGLLMTSALVAAGTLSLADDAWAQKATNPVQLRLGGYMEQKLGAAFQRQNTVERTGLAPNTVGSYGAPTGTFDVQTEAEIHFIGDGRLDNGLVIRTVVELEVTGSPGNIIDEQYLILRNGFGQVIIGAEDPVTSLMTTGYISVLPFGAGQSLTFDITPWIPAPTAWPTPSPTAAATHSVNLESFDNDATKIIYVSPRFFGLQLGVSYAPEATQDLQTGAPGNALPTKETWSDGWSLAANYEVKFDQVAIGLAGGWYQVRGSGTVSSATNILNAGGVNPNTDDPTQYGFGGRIMFGGLTAVAGYKKVMHMQGQNGAAPSAISLDGDIWNAGVRYVFGPNAVSFQYSQGNARGSTTLPGDDELDLAMLSYARTLAPGIKWTANLAYANYDNEPPAAAAPLAQPDYDGFAFITTFRLDW
jgi:predicted porin